MKNKNYNLLLIFFLIIFVNVKAESNEQFSFDVTNVEILENGKIFRGLNKGIATSNNGIVISADSFEYNKETNILIAKDNVKMEDTIENYTIFSDQVTYFKNDEKILTKGNSKASYINGQLINADSFEYNKETNILIAKDNVKMEDTIENYTIFSDQVTYFKNDEKILTKGNSKASYINGQLINADSFEYNKETNILIAKDNVKMEDTIENYTIFSDQVTYFKNDEKILTKGNSKASYINGQLINADSFEYNKETNILIAKDNVKMEDTIENYTIFSDQVTYFKNDEKILTKGNSKASYINGQLINADSFEYNKETNILIAKDNVKMEDTIENYTIFSDQVTYFKNDEKILTKGKTKSLINNKYEIQSKNVLFLINKNLLSSKERTTIKDKNSNFYQLDEFE